MATYVSDGLTLHYDVVGRGEPILCVHGATGAGMHEWSKLAARLADSFQLVIPDLRSHRMSEHRPGAVGIEYVVGDLLALVDELDVEVPHVMGFSFGAEVALDLELTHPGSCRSLVLLSPGLGDPKSSVPTRERLLATWPDSLRRLHTDTHGEDHWLEVMLELCQRAAVRPKADLRGSPSYDVRYCSWRGAAMTLAASVRRRSWKSTTMAPDWWSSTAQLTRSTRAMPKR